MKGPLWQLLTGMTWKIWNMENILSDQNKFIRVIFKNNCLLNFTINQGKRVNKVLRKFVYSKIMTKKR